MHLPKSLLNWIDSRFNKNEVELDNGAAFDVVRAAVNLVISSMLITFGTNHGLPLSTTYVTFMVAMGSSLADRAWSRESAVFRVTGVLSVIGGWFITAGVAFITCATVCLIMYFGGIIAKVVFMVMVVVMLVRSDRKYAKKAADADKLSAFDVMMRTRDPQLVWDMLQKHVRRTQTWVCKFALEEFNKVIDGFANASVSELRHSNKELRNEVDELKKYRRQEILGLKKSPADLALERNTWFHLGANSNQQLIYSLRRMLEPIKEHVDNNFTPVPQQYIEEFDGVRKQVNELMNESSRCIETGHFDNYRDILADADNLKDELSVIRKKQIDRMQKNNDGEHSVCSQI